MSRWAVLRVGGQSVQDPELVPSIELAANGLIVFLER